jgi:HAD superfamily hydrolase (TIGR01509 family)
MTRLNDLRGVIFDYGNTLVRLDPSVPSLRTDYADVVARPGAERLGTYLTASGALVRGMDADFVERFLEVRERNRRLAEAEEREIPAVVSLEETLLALLPAGAGDPVDLVRALDEFFAVEVELIRPMPGAQELLDALRGRRFKLAMLSNATSGRTIERVVGRMGWSGYFDPLVVSADIGVRKPRAEAFRAVLDRLSLSPQEVAMVGDSLYHDVKGGQALGLVAIHFTAIANAFDTAYAGSVHPDFSVSSHEELSRLLLQHIP